MTAAPLTLYPAIDLKGGKCVRLLRGDMASAEIYNDDPEAQARDFAAADFDWIHIVDLDGAIAGKSKNANAVRAILAATAARTQLGGGIRDLAAIESWLDAGLTRVILGSAAVQNPALVREAAQRFPGRIVVGVDALGGKVRTDGWAKASEKGVLDLARRFEDAGIAAIVFTDIGRDGALGGVNVAATTALADAISIPVIASGGVAGAADIAALASSPRIEGVIIGRALYDGRISAAAAISAAAR